MRAQAYKDMEWMSTLRGKTFQQTLNKTTRYTDLVDEVVRDSYDGNSKCMANTNTKKSK